MGKRVKNEDDFPIPYLRQSKEAANILQRETTSLVVAGRVKKFLLVFNR